MISNTFNNLDKSKKKKILDAVRREIVDYGIDGARVTNICLEAGIPRSAFYRYFDTLEDAFKALMMSIGEDRRGKTLNALLDPEYDIYKLAKEILTEIFDNPDEYILVRNVRETDFRRVAKDFKKPDKLKEIDKTRKVTFKLLMNLIKSLATSHYEDGLPKDKLLKDFDEYIDILKK